MVAEFDKYITLNFPFMIESYGSKNQHGLVMQQ